MDDAASETRQNAANVDVPEGYERVDCPMCGASGGEVALRGPDRILDASVQLTILRCGSCGLCYLNPRPKVERLGAYYPQNYHAHQEQKGDVTGSRALVRLRKLALRRLYGREGEKPTGPAGLLAEVMVAVRGADRFGDGLPVRGQGRLLDFGCGHGKLLRRMQVAGWDVVGLDFSEQAVAAVRASGVEAHQGTLPHPGIAPESFDAVTMQHALEHVPDPLPVLEATHDVLRPGGVLLVQVPNFDCWEVNRFGEVAIQIDLPRHLLHFEPETLRAMLERAGFTNVQVEARPRRGFVRKSIQRAREYGQPVPRWMDLKPVHQAICRRNRRNGHGSELIATAQKPE